MAGRPEAGKIEREEADSLELPAPAGWKKFIPKNSEIPKKNDVLFISPTGMEIRSRNQLTQFLRSNPGGPSPSEFDWTFGCLRRSARISKKAKATESPAEVPSKKRERSSNSNKVTKLKKKGNDTEEEGNGLSKGEMTDTLVESIEDAEMKDVDDSSLKEKTESAAKSIEGEVKAKVSDQDSGESQVVMNKNEPEKMLQEDSNINAPIVSAPEATEQNSAACENQEKIEVKEVSKDVPEETSAVSQNHEKFFAEENNKCELVLNEATKEENSAVSANQEKPQVDVMSEDVPFLNKLLESKEENSAASENQDKLGVKEASNGLHVSSVPIETKNEAVAVRKNPVDSEVSPHKADPIKEDLCEKELKDRTFLNDSHKWEQKKVSSS